MKKTIILNGEVIDYELRLSPKAKRVSITVKAGGEVQVTVPARYTQNAAEKFLHAQADWVLRQKKIFAHKQEPRYQPGGTVEDYKAHKKEARRFVTERLKYFNEFYQFGYGEISIRNQTGRWASCSAEGNLSFNYKIVKLPIRIADYIIVHELCHVKEHNHSPKFWALVARAIPEYKTIRKQLAGIETEI